MEVSTIWIIVSASTHRTRRSGASVRPVRGRDRTRTEARAAECGAGSATCDGSGASGAKRPLDLKGYRTHPNKSIPNLIIFDLVSFPLGSSLPT